MTGWVRNLADGTVEMLAAGEAAEVDAFVAEVGASHLAGYFTKIRQVEEGTSDGGGTGFEIRH